MSRAPRSFDAGVVIDRVRVRVRPRGEASPPPRDGARGARGPLRPGCHRIVVGELRIDTDAELGAPEARRLGERLAGALGEDLAALQARRVEAIRSGRSRGGAIFVPSLRVVLRGAEAVLPDLRAIALALAGAIERRST